MVNLTWKEWPLAFVGASGPLSIITTLVILYWEYVSRLQPKRH